MFIFKIKITDAIIDASKMHTQFFESKYEKM